MAANTATEPPPVVTCAACGLSTFSPALAALITTCPRCDAPVSARPALRIAR